MWRWRKPEAMWEAIRGDEAAEVAAEVVARGALALVQRCQWSGVELIKDHMASDAGWAQLSFLANFSRMKSLGADGDVVRISATLTDTALTDTALTDTALTDTALTDTALTTRLSSTSRLMAA